MSSIDQQIAQLKNRSRKRRDLDWLATAVASGACVTVLVTWGVGYLTRGWIRTTESSVYDTDARKAGTYFLTDWLFGCSLILLALAAFLVARPWSHRLKGVILGVLIGALAGAVLLPQSVRAWHAAEKVTVVRLQAEAYPFYDHYTDCGGANVTFASKDGSKTTWALYLARYTSAPGDVRCDHAVLYKGWQRVKNIDFPEGSYEPNAGLCCDTDVEVNAGRPFDKTRFLVTFLDDKTMTVRLRDFD